MFTISYLSVRPLYFGIRHSEGAGHSEGARIIYRKKGGAE